MDSKIQNKKNRLMLNLLLIGFFTVVFAVLAFVTLKSQNSGVYEKSCEQLNDAVNNLKYRLETENRVSQEKTAESLRLFVHFLRQNGQITQEKDSLGRQTTNFSTGETSYERVPRWTVRGKDISSLNGIIENVYSLTGALSAVYQKIPEGYLIVASNFDHSDKQLLTDIFIPNTSDIVPMIENGEIYQGNVEILKKQYVSAFFPLFLNSKISGMVSCMNRYEISKELTDYIKKHTVNYSGYLFLVTPSANIFLHPELSNVESLHAERMLNRIKSDTETGKIVTKTFLMPEKDYEVCQKTLYIRELDTYIGVCCPVSELQADSLRRFYIILLFVFLWLLSIMIIMLVNGLFFRLISRISDFVSTMAKGKIPQRYSSKMASRLAPVELVEIEKAVGSIIENKNKRIEFIEKLTDGDFAFDGGIRQGDDSEADMLLDLQKYLLVKTSSDKIRELEEIHADWINEGITKFIEILRFHGQDRNVLAYNIISNLVKYIGANQGAIYFTNEDDPQNVMLEIAACYAYEKQKLIHGKFSVNDGLLGRAYHEKRIVNITDLPPGYIKIVSGLGDAPPNNLIIVPLIFNQKNSGMLEIASFHIFEDYQVTFLSRIAESIASAISGLKINERTETLLQRSQEQSKLMKIQEVEMRRNLQEMRRLKEETESKDSEMRGLFRAIDATSLVTQYDKDGTIIRVNSRVIDLLQVSEEEIVGKNHADISSFKPDNKDYRKFWEDLRHGQTRSLVESVQTKDKTIWLSETFSPVTDDHGNVVKIINIGMDISSTKVLERQLRLQEREINRQMDKMNEKEKELSEKQKYIEETELEMKAFNSAVDSFVIRVEFTRRGIITSANSLFYKILGLSDEAVVGMDFASFLVPENITQFSTSLTILCSGKEQTEKLKLKLPIGSFVYIAANEFPIANTKGDVERIMLLGTIIDA
ncbi:MAG: Cache 3/Cache 2 fusion domain-containing protein [Bacteroidales bacterium]|nr:Cache 3/Cache 2 fusion domain-containing protein [Bacteroidales bacterium]